MADVKRQRLLTEAAGRMPSQDHTLERHLTLTPPTSGSVASRFMTEKSAFGVFGGASGRRNGRYTGSGRDARDILRSSAMRGKCRDERDEGNNNGTARMLVFECRPPGGAAGYVRGGCSQAARLTFPSIASVCLRGGLACGAWDVPEQRSIRSSDNAGHAEGSASQAAQARARAGKRMYSRS
jgi:hypothetical protein